MTNTYSVTTFAIDLTELDSLVNTEDKDERKRMADKIEKENEIKN